MLRLFILFILMGSSKMLWAQYAPSAGQLGSTALHKDSTQWACWANSCSATVGFKNIANQSLGYVSSGAEADACGEAGEGAVLSLGDAGFAVLQFPYPVRDGAGPDFAVFENAFNDSFLELAFVEVSSDGQHFVRFPSFSNSDTATQIGSFGAVDATKIHNLAGKYRYGYGTPFDLEDLKDSVGIDLQNITHIRIIDVVGSIMPDYARRDSRGVIINDPWNTPFNEGGFDLDGIGVINAQNQAGIELSAAFDLKLYPNPVSSGQFRIEFESERALPCRIYTLEGQLLFDENILSGAQINCENWPKGIYYLQLKGKGGSVKVVKL